MSDLKAIEYLSEEQYWADYHAGLLDENTIYSTPQDPTYSQAEIDKKLNKLEEEIQNSGGTVDAYTKTETDALLSEKANTSEVSSIIAKIPAQASATNQLADKDFVNSSISTATATFRGTVNSYNDLPYDNVDLNDYAFVKTIDTQGNTIYTRYKFNGIDWDYEYELNNSSFTEAQWKALNSGVTQTSFNNLTNDVSGLKTGLSKAQSDITNLTNSHTASTSQILDNKNRIATISETVAGIQTELLNYWQKIYPKNSIFITADETDPASIFGGTWSKIEGKFLLGSSSSYTLGSEGGSADAVVVEHNHTFTVLGSGSNGSYNPTPSMTANKADPAYANKSTTSVGVDGTGKNMPPYKVVAIWVRDE